MPARRRPTFVRCTCVAYRTSYDVPLWVNPNRRSGRWNIAGRRPTQYMSLDAESPFAETLRYEDLRTEEAASDYSATVWQLRIDDGLIVDYSTFELADAAGFEAQALVKRRSRAMPSRGGVVGRRRSSWPALAFGSAPRQRQPDPVWPAGRRAVEHEGGTRLVCLGPEADHRSSSQRTHRARALLRSARTAAGDLSEHPSQRMILTRRSAARQSSPRHAPPEHARPTRAIAGPPRRQARSRSESRPERSFATARAARAVVSS